MNIEITKANLIKHLSQICGIVEKKADFASLSHILFEIKGKQLSLTTSNMSVELSTTLELEKSASKNLDILVPGHKLLNLCRNLKDETIKMSFTDETLKIKSTDGNFKMSTMEKDQFPLLKFEPSDKQIKLPTAILEKAFKYTKAFIGPESSRTILQGVLIELNAKSLAAVATDGHRMSCFQSPIETPVEENQFILPRRSVVELASQLDGSVETSIIHYNDSFVRFENGTFSLTTLLISGKYPDYRSVIPKEEDSTPAVIDCKSLDHGLRIIRVLTNEQTHGVLCEFDENKLTLKTHNNEAEEGESEIKTNFKGDKTIIVFNINYLNDILNCVGSKEIEIFLQEDNKSCLLKKTDKEEAYPGEVRFVIMPMRL